ncbi:MAG: hypothetical protein ACREHG_00045, partial [Candidatus Saccharimonadales bacterium]
SFPKYDSLQREFGDKIQVLLCTSASATEVRNLFNRVEALRKLHLASVVSDTVLSGIFKHRTVPHVVLIDQSGLVRAVTYGVNRKDIKAVLAGRPVHLLVKRDGGPSYDSENPQIISDYQYYHRTDHFYFDSYIAPLTVPTAPGQLNEKDNEGNITRRIFQGSIQQLYRIAYGNTDEYNTTRVLLDFRKASSFRTVDQDSGTNCYTYDLIMHPGWPPAKAYGYMQRQLDDFFSVHSSEKKKRIKCFILKRVDVTKPLFSDNEKANVQKINKVIKFKQLKWWWLMNCINGVLVTPPLQIVDETGIDAGQKVTVTIDTDFNDLNVVNQSLKPYGLKMTVGYRRMDVIVLKDRK